MTNPVPEQSVTSFVAVARHAAICNDSATTKNVRIFRESILKVLKCYNFIRV